ncbi:Uncharacterised protein [Actinomyces bovis]|uniref:Polysaccharide biosynthesis protein n=2 Tax=Actinomyces bovis TaxID=1658 RepID=A0ABY1VNR9_9ACTO|nr:Uncharacterised protein [Actinomyces bovis]VEG53090.1 Uncharacterised protein [Actinomyces israelii]
MAFFAQGVSLLVSTCVSLLVPKLLGVSAFAYWQLFLFYSSYVGFFHFGLNDGVYLIEGGRSVDDLDWPRVGSQFVASVIVESALALGGLIAVHLIIGYEERSFVVSMALLYMVIANSASFLGMLFQALSETKVFSFSTLVDRVIFGAGLLGGLALGIEDYRFFVYVMVGAKVFSLIYCLIKGRLLFVGLSGEVLHGFKRCLRPIVIGVQLMVANLAGMLVLGIVRIVVDRRWGIETFGQVSFGLTLVAFVLLFVGQVSMVLFPTLRGVGVVERRHLFSVMRDGLVLLMPVAYCLSIPAAWLVGKWLPDYGPALNYFLLMVPLCVFDGRANLLGVTFMKVFGRTRVLLWLNVLSLVVASSLVGIGVMWGRGPRWVVISGVVAFVVRALVAERMVGRWVGAGDWHAGVEDVAFVFFYLLMVSTRKGLEVFLGCAVGYGIFLWWHRDRAARIWGRFAQKVFS